VIDFRQHVGIFGTTGSGKSTTLRTLLAGLKVPAVVWDLKQEFTSWPGVHWTDGLRVAAYDLDMPKYLGATAPGERFLSSIFRRRGIIPTLADLEREVDRSGGNEGIKAALLRAIAAKRPADWIAEPTADLGDILAGSARHIIPAGKDYLHQADWLLGRLLALPEASQLRAVIVFEEAHLLRSLDLSTAVRMLRSKGIGVILISQHPRDLRVDVLGNLNTRVYHRLLPGTPSDRAYLKEIPAGVDLLGVGECIIGGDMVKIDPLNLPPCEPWPYRRKFERRG
jgi:DNA helicase HerA-like ATPase